MHKYRQGDKVSYCGTRFKEDLNGALGIVIAYVKGTEHGVVVDFGDDYVMDEIKHLAPFQGHLKGASEKKPKGPQVEKRRGGKKKPEETSNDEG